MCFSLRCPCSVNRKWIITIQSTSSLGSFRFHTGNWRPSQISWSWTATQWLWNEQKDTVILKIATIDAWWVFFVVVNDPKGLNVYYCRNLKHQYKSALRVHFIGRVVGSIRSRTVLLVNLHSPYFYIFKYTRAVKQKVWNEAENGERDWAECEARTLRALKTLTPRFTDFFTDFAKKNRLFCSLTFTHINKAHYRGGLRTPFLP